MQRLSELELYEHANTNNNFLKESLKTKQHSYQLVWKYLSYRDIQENTVE